MPTDVTLVMKADNSDHLKKVKEVQQAHQSLNKTVIDNQKREKGLIEDIEGELTKLQERKRKAYTVEDIEKYNKKIAEAKLNLEEYNQAGVKVEKTQASMVQSVGKWIAGLGLLTTVLNSLKNTFKDTVLGMNLITQAGEAWTQMTYNVLTANNALNTSLVSSLAIGKQINELRKKERVDQVEIAKNQRLYNELYFAASDRRRTDAERIQLLDQAMIAHNLAVDKEIENLQEQKAIVVQQLINRPKSNKLLDEETKLNVALQQAESSRWSATKRIEAQRTSMMQEGIDKQIKQAEDLQKDLVRIQKEADVETAKDQQHATELYKKHNEQELKDKLENKDTYIGQVALMNKRLVEANKVVNEQTKQDQKDADQKELDDYKAKEDAKLEYKREVWNTVLESERMAFEIIANISDQKYQKEIDDLNKKTNYQLMVAGNDEKKKQLILAKSEEQKLKIESEFAKKRKLITIAQSIIESAFNVIKALGTPPVPNIPLATLAGTLGAIQIAVIGSQKFAKGGWTGKGGAIDETGQRMAGIVHEEEFVTKKGPAAKYRDVLEAINRDDKRAMIHSMNKIDIPEILAPSVNNNVLVENTGSNSRLDRLIAENKKLNKQIANSTSIQDLGNMKIVKRGNHTRIIKR